MKKGCPFLLHLISLLSWCVGNVRNQLFPHGPNMLFTPSPLLVTFVSWQVSFLEIISSGEKSGLVYFTLGGSC